MSKTIKKVVVTGGPCAGKTTALSWIHNAFSKTGYKVLFVPETATELITGGVAPWTCGTNYDYQVGQMRLQWEKEQIFINAAKTMPEDKILIICDRGMIDNRAYMTEDEFQRILAKMNLNEIEVRDSYDAVFHLVTAAKGAEQFYTTENNGARIESVERAIELDNQLISAWTGHPHLRVIDNTTDFNEKLKRLISEMTYVLGGQLPFNIKRKFVIDFPDIHWLESLKNCCRVEINQTYLITPEGEELRVRQRGEKGHYSYYMTSKRQISPTKLIQVEERLTQNQYLDLLMEADPGKRPIRKTRYCLTYDNQYFEIDIYPFWHDKAILEIELQEEHEEIRFPKELTVRKEVTGDPAYKNSTLAEASFNTLSH